MKANYRDLIGKNIDMHEQLRPPDNSVNNTESNSFIISSDKSNSTMCNEDEMTENVDYIYYTLAQELEDRNVWASHQEQRILWIKKDSTKQCHRLLEFLPIRYGYRKVVKNEGICFVNKSSCKSCTNLDTLLYSFKEEILYK